MPPRKKRTKPDNATAGSKPEAAAETPATALNDESEQKADIKTQKKVPEIKTISKEFLAKAKASKRSQEDFLNEAIETETANKLWLEMQHRRAMEDNVKISHKVERKFRVAARRTSRRGQKITVTFPEPELMPDILKEENHIQPPRPPPAICAITGKPARYRDPHTMLFYADLAAYKELRTQYPLPSNSLVSRPPGDDRPPPTFPTAIDLPVTSALNRRYRNGDLIVAANEHQLQHYHQHEDNYLTSSMIID